MTDGTSYNQFEYQEVFLPKERLADFSCFDGLLNTYRESPFYEDFNPLRLGRFLSNIILLEPTYDTANELSDFKVILQGENTKPLYGNIAKTSGKDIDGPVFERTIGVLRNVIERQEYLLTEIERISIDTFYFNVTVLYVPFLGPDNNVSKIICQLFIKQHDL